MLYVCVCFAVLLNVCYACVACPEAGIERLMSLLILLDRHSYYTDGSPLPAVNHPPVIKIPKQRMSIYLYIYTYYDIYIQIVLYYSTALLQCHLFLGGASSPSKAPRPSVPLDPSPAGS